MKTNEIVKWAITDTLKVDVTVLSIDGDRARITRNGRKLVVPVSELEKQ